MKAGVRKGLMNAGFATLLVIWALNFWVERRVFARLQRAQKEVSHLEDIRTELLRLISTYTEAETGQRGYLLTGDDNYLGPYLAARARLSSLVTRVASMLGNDEGLQILLQAGQAKLEELQRTIDLRKAGQTEAALAIMRTDLGKSLMDEIRQADSRLQAELDMKAARILQGARHQKRQAERLTWLTQGLLGGSLLSFYLVVRWIWREREQMLAAEREAKQVTERALATERAAHSEAARANRLKDEFLGIVSHELRTPLSAILNWATLLRDGVEKERELQEGLETIARNAQAQARLVDDLLDVGRIASGKIRLQIEAVDLREVVEAVAESLRPAVQAKGIRVKTLWGTGPLKVLGDADRLRQVVWNLASNAMKFTPRGGTIRLRLAPVDSWVELGIEDTGQGIKQEFLPRIFERFSQQDGSSTRQNSGLGLGLAITRHLVELHGGTIKAESPGENQGATFRVRFPMAAGREQEHQFAEDRIEVQRGAEAKDERTVEAIRLPGTRVLAIDDQVDACEAYARLLGRAGAEVRTAQSVAAALDILSHWTPHVILCDIGMPGQDGYSFIQTLRGRRADGSRDIPALALTAFTRPEDRRQALAAGFNGYLTKPVNLHELTRKVAELARGTGV
ncbi:MAG: CHASE3 domain-containing protein [Verrucomicrobia bacterium]|nr:CHASE3 domain-containing protein [Verrucomicrobiota bacterium]